MLKRKAILSFRLRRHAIRKYCNIEIPHVGIIRGVEHTNIRRKADENQALDLESLQEHLECSGKEARMHRFEDKVIIFGGPEQLDYLPATTTFLQTMLDLLTKIGAPLAKIIVCVNDRNSRALGAFF